MTTSPLATKTSLRVTVLAAALALAGCTALRSTPPLPVRYSVPRGPQLVINSDFKMPEESRLLAELEQLRGRVSRALELPVSEQPIQVYLFKSEKLYRRFRKAHFPNFPKRRAFFVRRQDDLAVYAHYGDRVAEDLRHEVAHGYMHSVVHSMPLWLDEGLAEYFETSAERRGLHMQHVGELVVELPQGDSLAWTPDLSRLEGIRDIEALEQIDYAESWAWVHWLLETTPARREALHSYLRALRKGDSPPPLTEWLFEHDIEFDSTMLVEHVRGLAKSSPSRTREGRTR
ncbi:MAG: DUF1570 domain-containing protein [Pirellulales bacterium]|nr:DUF1570 domain-containing protein [Pirellulales bacterium]